MITFGRVQNFNERYLNAMRFQSNAVRQVLTSHSVDFVIDIKRMLYLKDGDIHFN